MIGSNLYPNLKQKCNIRNAIIYVFLFFSGFPCRCGGLYCSTHRYSDKHDCNFNYKEMAQEHIRKQNPVVVASKIQKI